MLQSVLLPIPSFAMSCFELHVGLCKKNTIRVYKLLVELKREGEENLTAWNKMTLPMKLGGLGFRDIQDFNQAMLPKIGWRIITKPDCLLAETLLSKYCHKTSFLKVTKPPTSSHGWKGILLGRDRLLKHLGKLIGDGETTNFWTVSWISPSSDLIPSGPILPQDQDLIVADLLSRETKE